jgi:hypothetical protein
MPDSDYSRKHRLECLRLASDLAQLANSSVSPVLRLHLLRNAEAWTSLAEFGPDARGPRMGLEPQP